MSLDTKHRSIALAAVIAASVGTASPVLAQTEKPAATTDEFEISEIIVTARRTEEPLQDVPISITVFNQEQLTNRNVTNATDLANFTPSLSANNNFGTENTSFAIRGFVQDAATPPSVGTYFADVVAPRGPTQGTQAGDSVGPGSFFDLQNVQVLKGPQGTLFGRNTTGGAVLLVPQKPTANLEGFAEASYGNHDMYRLQGALNAPLSETVRFRIAADHQQRDGYLHNISGVGPKDFNDIDYTAVRASLVLDFGDVENYTIASWSKSDTHGSVQKLIGCNPLAGTGEFSCAQLEAEEARGDAGFYNVASAIEDPVSRIKQWQVINTTTWKATDNLTIKNIASYAEFTDKQRTELFGTNWQAADLPFPLNFAFASVGGLPAAFTGVFPIPGHDSADQSTYTEELQLQGSSDDSRFIYQGGVYFEWSDPLSLVGNQSSVLARCTDLANLACIDPLGILTSAQFGVPISVGAVNYTAGKTRYRDRGIYAQSTYSLTDQLKLTTGVRYTWDKQENTAQRISYSFDTVPPIDPAATPRCTDPSTAPSCSQKLKQKSDKPTWLLDLDYKPTDDVLVYGKYARGYRAGGVFTNAPIDHRTFDPEKVDNYEVGLKTTYRGAVYGTFNVALFYNDFSDQQLQLGFNARIDPITGQSAPVSPTTAIINAGKSRIYGAEVETTIVPVRDLTFGLSYAYLKTEIRSIAPASTDDPNYQPQGAFIRKGDPLALSPKHKVVASGEYKLPLSETIGTVSFGATYVYTTKQLTNYVYASPSTLAGVGHDYGSVGSRGLLSLNAGWEGIAGSTVDVVAFDMNVTNKHYYTFIPGLGDTTSIGAETAAIGEPRMYGVRLRYRFGEK